MIREVVKQTEQVLTVLRKEGDMAKPADTRCWAATKSGRCKREILFDKELDAWMKFCEEHTNQLNESRVGDMTKPVIYTGKDDK